jgi:hypothetical protein
MSLAVADRDLPTEEARDLLDLAYRVAADELAPRAAEAERVGTFPATSGPR